MCARNGLDYDPYSVSRIMYPELISNYLPMTLFTLASFSSFYMQPNKGNDRIGFLITLFLVLSTMTVNITSKTPGANQITFIGGREREMCKSQIWKA